MKTISIIYKSLIVVFAAVGILLQCGIFSGSFSLTSFRMFTTLSNLAVALYFLWAISCLCRSKDTTCPGLHWKFLITMGICLTGLVAFFMLRGMFDMLPQAERLGITFLHDVVPPMTFLDYLLFDQKGWIRKWMPPFAAIFPICYVILSMIAAPFLSGSDRYPYPFLNVDTLGWPIVLLNILLLSAAYFMAGYLVYGLDRLLWKKGRIK